jgi:hypothetical protein
MMGAHHLASRQAEDDGEQVEHPSFAGKKQYENGCALADQG